MKIDLYTKAVLTIIAVCLIWISVRDINFSRPAEAAPAASSSQHTPPLKVVIVGVENPMGGQSPPLPVAIQSINRGSFQGQPLPWDAVRTDSMKVMR